jgi:hypothetical protein
MPLPRLGASASSRSRRAEGLRPSALPLRQPSPSCGPKISWGSGRWTGLGAPCARCWTPPRSAGARSEAPLPHGSCGHRDLHGTTHAQLPGHHRRVRSGPNRESTLEGLRAAAARGRKGGRRRKLSEEDLAMVRALLKDPSLPVAQVAKRLGVSRATFYAYFPEARRRSIGGAAS